MYPNAPRSRGPLFGGLGRGPIPPDLIALLATLFVTYSLQFFTSTATVVALLRLTPLVWKLGLLWQLATYAVTGIGPASIWILVELILLYLFARDVYWRLGRRRFRILLAWTVPGAAGAAILVQLLGNLVAPSLVSLTQPFILMQGQRLLLAVFIAAFATLFRDATIYLFFVLPVQARWFIPVELGIAFIAFLGSRDLAGTHDLAGFLGVCAAIGITWSHLTGRLPGRGGGRRGGLREIGLRLQERWMRWRLDRLRRRRGFRVVDGEGGGRRGGNGHDPWVH